MKNTYINKLISTCLVSFIILALCTACVEERVREEPEPGLEQEMVLIPGGEFMMGAEAENDWGPVHKVVLDSFYMDKYEVTNAQYFEFCQATDHRLPEFWGMDKYRSGPRYPNHPVIGISYGDASDYAEWIGKRLPTEAEWEYAAKGGMDEWNYPTGEDLDTTFANYNHSGKGAPVRVGSYPANGYGLYDMAGNVWEFVSDFYALDYYGNSPESNPTGPADGKVIVIRGGGWHSGPFCNRVYFRQALPTGWVDFAVGFRCAKDIDQN